MENLYDTCRGLLKRILLSIQPYKVFMVPKEEKDIVLIFTYRSKRLSNMSCSYLDVLCKATSSVHKNNKNKENTPRTRDAS